MLRFACGEYAKLYSLLSSKVPHPYKRVQTLAYRVDHKTRRLKYSYKIGTRVFSQTWDSKMPFFVKQRS